MTNIVAEVEEEMKFNGIKKAVGFFNNTQMVARIMLDKSTGDVWTDLFFNTSDYKNYHDNNIVMVVGKDNLYSRDNTIKMAKLKQLCKDAMDNKYDDYYDWH